MKRYKIEIPKEIEEQIEKLPDKPGSWLTPEIDAILIKYGNRKQVRSIANIIEKYYGKRVSTKTLQNRINRLREEGFYDTEEVLNDRT